MANWNPEQEPTGHKLTGQIPSEFSEKRTKAHHKVDKLYLQMNPMLDCIRYATVSAHDVTSQY